MEKNTASIRLTGEKFPLPGINENKIELQKPEKLVDRQKKEGQA